MSRWTVLGVLVTARIGMALAFQSVAAVLPFIVDDLGLTYAQGGTLIGLFMLPGVLLAIPSGWLGGRLGDKRATLLGLAALVAGSLIMAQATSFTAAAIGRLVAGIGGILLTVLLAKMTTDWFAGRELATALGCLVSSWPIGLGLGMAGFGWWAAVAGWPNVLLATAAFCALAALPLWLLYRPPPGRDGTAAVPSTGFRLGRRSLELALLAGIVWAAFNAGLILFLGFAPLLLIEQGWAPAAAAGAASLLMWLCIPLTVLGGHLADRTGKGDRIIVVASLATGLLMAALPWTPLPVLVIGLAGLIAGAPAGAIMALPRLLPADERAAGFGVYFTVNFAGMTGLPPLAGGLVDLSGSATPAVLLAAFAMAVTAPLLWLFRVRAARPGRMWGK